MSGLCILELGKSKSEMWHQARNEVWHVPSISLEGYSNQIEHKHSYQWVACNSKVKICIWMLHMYMVDWIVLKYNSVTWRKLEEFLCAKYNTVFFLIMKMWKISVLSSVESSAILIWSPGQHFPMGNFTTRKRDLNLFFVVTYFVLFV